MKTRSELLITLQKRIDDLHSRASTIETYLYNIFLNKKWAESDRLVENNKRIGILGDNTIDVLSKTDGSWIILNYQAANYVVAFARAGDSLSLKLVEYLDRYGLTSLPKKYILAVQNLVTRKMKENEYKELLDSCKKELA